MRHLLPWLKYVNVFYGNFCNSLCTSAVAVFFLFIAKEGHNDYIFYVRPLCLEEIQIGDVLLAQLAIQAFSLMQINLIFLCELFH